MSVIKITVNDQDLVCTEKPVIASQGVQEDQVEFTFSEQWDNLGKVAVFFNVADKDQVYTAIIDADGKAVVPWEVTQEDGAFYIGAYGTSDDVIYTSNLLRYTLEKGIYTIGQESEPPTPDLIRQILTIMGNIDGSIQDLRAEDVMLNERIDQIVAGGGDSEAVLLYGPEGSYANPISVGIYSLADDVDNYDYLEVYMKVGEEVCALDRLSMKHGQTFHYTDEQQVEHTGRIYTLVHTYVAHQNADYPGRFGAIRITVGFYDNIMILHNHWYWAYEQNGTVNYGFFYSDNTGEFPRSGIYNVYGCKKASAAEVADIRVGVDGTVYDTAGTAVRTQFTNENIVLSTVANSIENITGNKPIIDWQRGYISLPATGGTVDLTTHTNLTDYISTVVPCQAGDVFGAVIHGGPSYARWRAYLDADNKVLARGDSNFNFSGTFTVPSTAGITKMVINTKIAAGDMFLYKVSQTPTALTGSLLMPPGGSDGTE